MTADRPTYGRTARLRLALAEAATDVSDQSRALVSTVSDEAAQAGEWVEQAKHVLDNARELLDLAVAYERQRGTSWEDIGERLGITKQAVHERYAPRVKRLNDDLITSWALGDPTTYVGLREAISDPDGAAARLDRWARARGDERPQPVSGHLPPPMTTTEHVTMTTAVATLLGSMRSGERGHVAGLEIGHARRKVELYERMLTEETARPGTTGTDVDQVQDLLAGARARLAELENAGEQSKGA